MPGTVPGCSLPVLPGWPITNPISQVRKLMNRDVICSSSHSSRVAYRGSHLGSHLGLFDSRVLVLSYSLGYSRTLLVGNCATHSVQGVQATSPPLGTVKFLLYLTVH